MNIRSVVFFQAEDGIRDIGVTGVQTCALPISPPPPISTTRSFFNLYSLITCSTKSSTFLAEISRIVVAASSIEVPNLLASIESASFAERSEEHTSELQSRQYLVCRLLLEKKKHK